MNRFVISYQKAVILCIVTVFVTGSGQGLHTGIGGDANSQGDVTMAGCTCHAEQPDNSVTVVLDGIPYHYGLGQEYELRVQLIGGPAIDTTSQTGGFSMKVSSGTLGPGTGYDGLVQNWEDDSTSLTHTDSGSKTADRTWVVSWTSPEEVGGAVTFWLAGNAVNGDSIPSELDRWNRLTTTVDEGSDNGRTRTVFSGNGDIDPPAPIDDHVDIHLMGAELLAHWLGLLGFISVFLVIIFCGFFLRYGFSRHYEGRSNLLKLRIKHLRRGDQL
jgi:hypothetical protein